MSPPPPPHPLHLNMASRIFLPATILSLVFVARRHLFNGLHSRVNPLTVGRDRRDEGEGAVHGYPGDGQNSRDQAEPRDRRDGDGGDCD